MSIEVIMFDLGGVLIELTGVPTMQFWSKLTEEEIWHRWLHSPAVRDFESGLATPESFAERVVDEFALSTTPQAFMAAFVQWPSGPFAGVLDLLAELSGRYHLSCLSNTNHLHWSRFEQETTLLSALDSHFASFQIGKMKPDPDIYLHAIESLGCSPDRILFLDDNQINVDGAHKVGMNAMLTRGVSGITASLEHHSLL